MTWTRIDTWIVITAALAAMACALPGVWLVLRRQSLMGDVLSHTTLPGLVLGFLFVHALESAGLVPPASAGAVRHAVLLGGAMITGVLSAVLAEAIQNIGRVEAGAALGVVLTTLFAFGLLLIRIAADSVHLDQDCVLFGTVESVALGARGIPEPTQTVAIMLVVNVVLTLVFYKELLIAAFDPALATTLGFPARLIHYGLMAITAATVVAAFEIVGSILVIAMLIVPAATAHLLTDRLPVLILLSLVIGLLAAILGHVGAIVLPPVVFGAFGYEGVGAASTAGMTSLACGFLFGLALVFSPQYGLVARAWSQASLTMSIVRDDVLGLLYRAQEAGRTETTGSVVESFRGISGWLVRTVVGGLQRRGLITTAGDRLQLTGAGTEAAARVVRGHRLWESYVSRHFAVPEDHLHAPAERVEHFLDPELQAELAAELDQPSTDPQRKAIPGQM